ncbi:MAG: MBL fold metallo-hydrolase, partial [Mesorhizobium sp.]
MRGKQRRHVHGVGRDEELLGAGIDHKAIDTILISHFHPDHVWGLMEKGTNDPVFPNAELIVNATEYNWWT